MSKPINPNDVGKIFDLIEIIVDSYDNHLSFDITLAKLSNAYHYATGEKPCFKCDKWHTRESHLCENCDPHTWAPEEKSA